MIHRISAGAIVELGGRVLLVRQVQPGRHDFWVCPGGGINGEETLEEAAAREVLEETGLTVDISKLLYIEDLVNAECRLIKFWFSARLISGSLDTTHPEALAENIVQANWLTKQELGGKTVFPTVLRDRYWIDRINRFPDVTRLQLCEMEI